MISGVTIVYVSWVALVLWRFYLVYLQNIMNIPRGGFYVDHLGKKYKTFIKRWRKRCKVVMLYHDFHFSARPSPLLYPPSTIHVTQILGAPSLILGSSRDHLKKRKKK